MSDGAAAPEVVTDVADTERPPRPLCILAVPHNGAMVPEALGTLAAPSVRTHVDVIQAGSSLLCHNFNKAWCDALNHVPRPTYFAMCHSDISAPERWLDALIDEMEAHGADLVSAVVPIKDFRGITSTALMDAGSGTLRRLTAHEMRSTHPETKERMLPDTFDGADLAKLFEMPPDSNVALCVNSGLWVCKFGPWAETVCFETGDRITRDPDPTHPSGERFVARVFSEDWLFSSTLIAKGIKVMATQRVQVTHFGRAPFACGGENHRPWGMQHDQWISL